jgi:hypothetical protein
LIRRETVIDHSTSAVRVSFCFGLSRADGDANLNIVYSGGWAGHQRVVADFSISPRLGRMLISYRMAPVGTKVF